MYCEDRNMHWKVRMTNILRVLVDTDWLIIGDFNFIRRHSDRNKPWGNNNDMLSFNAAISNLRLEELKLYGNHYT
jgi:hypothetical protein